jgi:hypothetical protein
MNLIYAPDYSTASTFALHYDLMPGDWKWIRDARALRDYPRAEIYKVPRWDMHPRRPEIDAAMQRARSRRRLGMLTDVSH